MAMNPKQLSALVDKEKAKREDRARPAMRSYDVPPKYPGRVLPSVDVTGENEAEMDAHRRFVREQEEMEAKNTGTTPTPLADVLE